MASKTRKFGGDFVLESRHLVGLFLLLVVIFGVVFTLGYLMGRSQGDGSGHVVVASSIRKPDPPAASPAPAKASSAPAADDPDPAKKNSDWDFYHSADPRAASDHLQAVQSPGPTYAAASKPAQGSPQAKNAKPPKPALGGSLIPKGTIMLQVAAVLHQDDALALAQALQKKKFPAIVLPPSTDKYYRVQVGPYPDAQAAASARKDLEANGFKSITKR
jgi:DedD protein